MHTPTEIISLADVENTARLIAAYILNREGKNE
jgi:putative aminopeptidase FrvX